MDRGHQANGFGKMNKEDFWNGLKKDFDVDKVERDRKAILRQDAEEFFAELEQKEQQKLEESNG